MERRKTRTKVLNSLNWDRLPKTKFSSMKQLEFGVYDAVAVFNIGRKATILIYEKLGMSPGKVYFAWLF